MNETGNPTSINELLCTIKTKEAMSSKGNHDAANALSFLKKFQERIAKRDSKIDQISADKKDEFARHSEALTQEFEAKANEINERIKNLYDNEEGEYKKAIQEFNEYTQKIEEKMDNADRADGTLEGGTTEDIRKFCYENMGIDFETNNNGTTKKFLKGMIDSIIISNAKLVQQIVETKGAILGDIIAYILSREGLKQIAQALGTSVAELFSGDAYQTGKSVGELGLVTSGAGLAVSLAKKGAKVAVKMGAKEAMHEAVQRVSELSKKAMEEAKNAAITTAEIMTPPQPALATATAGVGVPAKNMPPTRDMINQPVMRSTENLSAGTARQEFGAGTTKQETNVASDIGKVDNLQLNRLSDCKTIPDFKRYIERYTDELTPQYLIGDIRRGVDSAKRLEEICQAVINNKDRILSMSRTELNDFRYVFQELRKQVKEVYSNPNISKSIKLEFMNLYNTNFHEVYNLLSVK